MRPTRTWPSACCGTTEVHINWIERLELNDGTTGRKVLPEIDLADAQDPRERRPNCLALNGGADLPHVRFGCFLLSRGLVVLHPGDDALFYQLLHAAIIHFREIALRLERRQLGPLLPRIEFDEDVALPHRLARLEGDSRHRTRKVRADHDAVNGLHRADHAQSWPATAPFAPQRS